MRPALLAALAGLCALATATPARADLLPSWSYSTAPLASPLASDNNPFTGGVTLSPVASTAEHGSADILLTNIRLFSGATAASPDVLSAGGNYSITLWLRDAASGIGGTFSFAGKLGGTFSLSSADLTNSFTGATSETLLLGPNAYTVSLLSYVAPGAPPSTPPGGIYAHVGPLGGGSSSSAPEPSTLVLCAVGVAGCLASRLKGGRRATRAL